MNYTPQEFNALAAKSEGIQYAVLDGCIKIQPLNGALRGFTQVYKPYSDLNQLMPLFWKYRVNICAIAVPWWRVSGGVGSHLYNIDSFNAGESKDPVQAIRDCLFSIWSES